MCVRYICIKRDEYECLSFRGINLLSAVGKLYDKDSVDKEI